MCEDRVELISTEQQIGTFLKAYLWYDDRF